MTLMTMEDIRATLSKRKGYLTIKGYINGTYLLGIPNFEVRQALNEIVLPTLTMRIPKDLFDYIYAILHSSNYRDKFKEQLK